MPSLESEIEGIIETFTNNLKQRKFKGSRDLALNSVQLWKKIIGQMKWQNARELMDTIKRIGKDLAETAPSETVIGNMTRRMLKIVRDEYAMLQKGKQEESDLQDSLQKILTADESDSDYTKNIPLLKPAIMEHIGEFLAELESSEIDISAQALEHIHANEIIMTIGYSKTVSAFLKSAAKNRVFQVIVAECAPFFHGHQLAADLAEARISTTLIPDSAIFAMMARVNKVIIGTHSVMANGGLKAVCGTHTLALAAKHYSVPFVVCAPMFKLCPEYVCSLDQDGFNQFVSPEEVLNNDEGKLVSKVNVYNPIFDYVPPELVTLFISNTGGNAPSYIYRLLSELYHPLDVQL
ncbi:translation initiation factor eIF-2B subunit beta-like [Daphnia pulex]|uniref:translation initiation factor eIF-2B subunit beta-like n=1 Tax=Daphnia pulex TaxID=6669 RepID=UPI001EE1363E|nr:translation initiation factor eIF-2B subunit beta-like [Daphnia pulex]XP_046633267.1 translation initiation factor eIF-2B subunit beta-like [Daphnia pulicaria]